MKKNSSFYSVCPLLKGILLTGIFIFKVNFLTIAQFTERAAQAPLQDIEFLGMNYDEVGYTLNPGEKPELHFRNNSAQKLSFPVKWELKTYAGESITSGNTVLSVIPGGTGKVPFTIPQGLKDGPYNIYYTPEVQGWSGTHPFFFDFRNPETHAELSLNIVALLENMDSEGWTRMMLGPLARFCHITNQFPENLSDVDAVIVVAEALDLFNPRFFQLQDFIRSGGTAIVYGKTAPALNKMLPVTGSSEITPKGMPLALKPAEKGPWTNFNPSADLLHYPIRVRANQNAEILATWSDDSPAVVSGSYGYGKVFYVGAGTLQVWQKNDGLKGADEMALRLLYNAKGGEAAVKSMLAYADKNAAEEKVERIAARDRVFEGLKIRKPEEFMVVSRNNIGRFGWLTHEEGSLTENIEGLCLITPVRTQETYTTIPYHVFDFSFGVVGDNSPIPTGVRQTWFAKNIHWKFANGDKVTTTLSLGSPAIRWEGNSKEISISGSDFTHVAIPVKNGMRIFQKGERIDPKLMTENWMLTFMALDTLRDMPQLIVLTKRPESITFVNGLQFGFKSEGFETMFTSRLYGIKRLSPGETLGWVKSIPQDAISNASRWSRIVLNYPVNCEEIAWVEGEKAMFADKFIFQNYQTDWKTKALSYTTIPPIYFLAKNVGSPVDLPANLIDLNCPTKYGPLMAVAGSSSLVSVGLPNTDHRAVIPAEGRMVLDTVINRNVTGLGLGSTTVDAHRMHQGGMFNSDLMPYDNSHQMHYNQAPQVDLYKWWYVFNAVIARPVYNDSTRQRVDAHWNTRYWETLNFYPHKSIVFQKREPWTGIEYMTSFIWPTDTKYGWRYIGDIQEASAVNAYSFTNYARYYGDWTTLRANWNLCRELHDFLIESMDWACLSSGAREQWNATGLDMANSEPYGRLAFAYAAEHAGYQEDALKGKIGGARTLLTAVARLGLEDYLYSISTEGDPWRNFKGFYFFNEFGMAPSANKRGGITLLNSSKGGMHELALAYKLWAPEAMDAEQKAFAAVGSNSLCDMTQRLFLGWNPDSLLNQVVQSTSSGRRGLNWQSASDLYDMAVISIGNIPVFLSDWAPAELVSGLYIPESKEMNLVFNSELGEAFNVKIYSQYKPVKLMLNGAMLNNSWIYDEKSGWLTVNLSGSEIKNLNILFGDKVAPLHPYFSSVNEK
jgi:hypothetical protein